MRSSHLHPPTARGEGLVARPPGTSQLPSGGPSKLTQLPLVELNAGSASDSDPLGAGSGAEVVEAFPGLTFELVQSYGIER
jgi:hypothetical protein